MQLPIRTERLTIRPLERTDIDAYAALYGQPESLRYVYDVAMTREELVAHLERRLPAVLPAADGAWMNLAIDLDGMLVGQVAVCLRSKEHRQCEIGYGVTPSHWGRGIASEAAAAALHICFEHLDAHRVVGRIDARNIASARVLQRLGMRLEAHLRENEFVKGEWTDEQVFAITRDEWAQRAQA